MQPTWNESKTVREAFIVQPEPGFYRMLNAFETLGYYPEGHWKNRRGSWGGVLRFGGRLVLSLIASPLTRGGAGARR